MGLPSGVARVSRDPCENSGGVGVEAGHNPGRVGASTYELYTDISVLSYNRVMRVASAPRLGSSLMVRDHEKKKLESGRKIEVARFGGSAQTVSCGSEKSR